MKQIERMNHYPKLYGQTFSDVIEYYTDRGEDSFTWGYGKSDRFRVRFIQDAWLTIQLDSIDYNGDWEPRYTPVYRIDELVDNEPVHSSYEPERGTVPYDASTIPELVLRSLLHSVQSSVRLRTRNGLK